MANAPRSCAGLGSVERASGAEVTYLSGLTDAQLVGLSLNPDRFDTCVHHPRG
jgi:hypothetical protein